MVAFLNNKIFLPYRTKFLFVLAGIMISGWSHSQNTFYKQFWNEFQFTHPLGQKFALEMDLGSSFSNTPDDRSRLSKFTQFAGTAQLHYFLSDKWKLGLVAQYFTNSYVPEIGQREYPEFRLSTQAMYYFNKIKKITATRGRIEFRYLENNTGTFESVWRYRQMYKYTKPLNSNYIRAGTFFAFVSEEVFFKTPADVTGPDLFDRNMLTIGIGYSVTDDLQIDVDLTNEFVPRSGGNTINNAVQLNLNLNNPFGYIERIFHVSKP